MNNLKNEIHDYWTNRARGYSEYNQQEMADARRTMWRDKLLSLLGNQFPEKKPQEIKILDVGTGPGFFAILLAEAGYQVTAIDYTEEMLKEAQSNAGELTKCIVWKTGDAQALDVESNSFDVIVTRNVTWNLPRPDLAYREWLRVLKPGVFFIISTLTGTVIFIMKKNAAAMKKTAGRQRNRTWRIITAERISRRWKKLPDRFR